MARSVKDLMRAAGISERTAYAAIKRGELPGYYVGRKVVIPEEAFQAFIQGRWTPSPRPLAIKPVVQSSSLLRKVG
ncbi:MAG: helix-turn-helix domain-containing protein [Thermomicrobiales bacterium]